MIILMCRQVGKLAFLSNTKKQKVQTGRIDHLKEKRMRSSDYLAEALLERVRAGPKVPARKREGHKRSPKRRTRKKQSLSKILQR